MTTTIYTTPTCAFCKATKAYFQENNIDYKEVDVSSDTEAAQAMVAKSGQMGVPVIIVAQDNGTEEIIVGFDQKKLSEALHIAPAQ